MSVLFIYGSMYGRFIHISVRVRAFYSYMGSCINVLFNNAIMYEHFIPSYTGTCMNALFIYGFMCERFSHIWNKV